MGIALVCVGAVLLLLFVAVVAVIGIYNRLIVLRNRVDNAWSQIDVQLKRRYDLIPNLVETVKGYATHERETLEKVVQARNSALSAMSGASVADRGQAEAGLSGTLKSLFALGEAYPDLKASANFAALQEELAGTEGKIAYARQYYNDEVRSYNTRIQSFPSNVIAGRFGFKQREYFQADDESRGPVQVRF